MLFIDAADCGVADCGPVTPFVGVVIGTPDGVVAGVVFRFVIGFAGGFMIGVEAGFEFGFTIGLDVGFGFGLEFGFGAGAPVSVVVVESSAFGFTIGLELGFGFGFEFGLGTGALPAGGALWIAVPFDPVVPVLPPFDCARQTALAELNSSADAIIRPSWFFISPPLRIFRYRSSDIESDAAQKICVNR